MNRKKILCALLPEGLHCEIDIDPNEEATDQDHTAIAAVRLLRSLKWRDKRVGVEVVRSRLCPDEDNNSAMKHVNSVILTASVARDYLGRQVSARIPMIVELDYFGEIFGMPTTDINDKPILQSSDHYGSGPLLPIAVHGKWLQLTLGRELLHQWLVRHGIYNLGCPSVDRFQRDINETNETDD